MLTCYENHESLNTYKSKKKLIWPNQQCNWQCNKITTKLENFKQENNDCGKNKRYRSERALPTVIEKHSPVNNPLWLFET